MTEEPPFLVERGGTVVRRVLFLRCRDLRHPEGTFTRLSDSEGLPLSTPLGVGPRSPCVPLVRRTAAGLPGPFPGTTGFLGGVGATWVAR